MFAINFPTAFFTTSLKSGVVIVSGCALARGHLAVLPLRFSSHFLSHFLCELGQGLRNQIAHLLLGHAF